MGDLSITPMPELREGLPGEAGPGPVLRGPLPVGGLEARAGEEGPGTGRAGAPDPPHPGGAGGTGGEGGDGGLGGVTLGWRGQIRIPGPPQLVEDQGLNISRNGLARFNLLNDRRSNCGGYFAVNPAHVREKLALNFIGGDGTYLTTVKDRVPPQGGMRCSV